MSTIDDLIKQYKDDKEDDTKDRKVLKTIPLKPEWRTKAKEMESMKNKLQTDYRSLLAFKKRFWVMVEDETKTYEDMQMSDDLETITIYEDK